MTCLLCGSDRIARRRLVAGYPYALCGGCRVWRLTGEAGEAPPRTAGSDHERRVRMLGRTIAEIEAWTAPGRLLEIGSGPGHLLEAARRRGWEVVGVEPDPASATSSRKLFGLQPIASEWHDGVVEDGDFDAVVLHHVLEHLPDPPAALAAAHRALRPGGVLHVAVPNARTVDRFLDRRSTESIFDPPRHLWVFSDRTLPPLVRRAGFEVVRSRPQVSNALGRFVAREAGGGARPATGTSLRGNALAAAATLARTVAPGSAVRLFAVRPGRRAYTSPPCPSRP
jgi:SAM-dependent methyltransferase